MKTWKDARTPAAKRALLREAWDGRSAKDAAKVLGLNRQYFHELVKAYDVDRPDSTDKSDSTDTGDISDSTDTERHTDQSTSVGLTPTKGLNYADARSTLPTVNSETATAAPSAEERVPVTFDLPKSDVEWLDLEAVRRKHAANTRKTSRRPIVVEALRHYREHLEAGGRRYPLQNDDEKGGSK